MARPVTVKENRTTRIEAVVNQRLAKDVAKLPAATRTQLAMLAVRIAYEAGKPGKTKTVCHIPADLIDAIYAEFA